MASVQANRSSSGAAGALGLHEELSTGGVGAELRDGLRTAALRCTCGPEHLRLRSEHGELVKPRGGCVNRCEYCAQMAALENSEMLGLDAASTGVVPGVLMVLGTRQPFPAMPGVCECDDLDGAVCERCATSRAMMAPYSLGLQLVTRTLRRYWPDAQYAALVEYTTGYGPRSGGLRRPHWNLLWKGIPAVDCDVATAIAAHLWCKHVDAEEHAQHGQPIYSPAGLFRYLAKHFQKGAQTPPDGFTGQRFNCSRGYFGTDAATGVAITRAMARARAKDALRLKRELWKAQQRHGAEADAYDVELDAQLAYRQALATRWVLASESGARLGDAGLRGPAAARGRDALAARRARAHGRLLSLLAGDFLPLRELVLFTLHDQTANLTGRGSPHGRRKPAGPIAGTRVTGEPTINTDRPPTPVNVIGA